MISRKKLGEYRLLRRVGVGGMAEVYEAELGGTEGHAKRLAIKVLLPHFQEDQAVINSFIDEASIASKLHHPNIVPVYDFGRVDSLYHLVMEYQQWDLRSVLKRCERAGQLLPVEAAVFIGHELAVALHHIHTHERAIIHRDVSPHNVFIDRLGYVKLGDFGVAKAAARLSRTVTGQIKGKLAYLAPEQVTGDPITPRTDVYAAGLLLFEMLTGTRFFVSGGEGTLLALARKPAVRLPSATRPDAAPLDEIVGSALQPHPAMRTRDAALLAEQLGALLRRDPYGPRELVRLVESLPAAEAANDILGDDAATSIASASFGSISSSKTRSLGISAISAIEPHTKPWVLPAAVVALAVAIVLVIALWPSEPLSTARETMTPPVALDAATTVVARSEVDAGSVDSTVYEVVEVTSQRDTTSRRALVPEHRRSAGPGRPRMSKVRHADKKAARRSRQGAGAKREPKKPNNREAKKKADVLRHTLKGQLKALVAAAKTRGLFYGDLPSFDSQLTRARQAVDGDAPNAAAAKAVASLRSLVESFRPDQPFIRRKLARLGRAIKKHPAQRERLNAESQKILRLVLAERLVAASKRISAQLDQLR